MAVVAPDAQKVTWTQVNEYTWEAQYHSHRLRVVEQPPGAKAAYAWAIEHPSRRPVIGTAPNLERAQANAVKMAEYYLQVPGTDIIADDQLVISRAGDPPGTRYYRIGDGVYRWTEQAGLQWYYGWAQLQEMYHRKD